MSYQYGQYPENFSNPTTPLDAYPMPTWETLQQDAQQQAQSLQDSQQQHHSEVTSGAPPYRMIQLDEHPLTVPSQPCDDATLLLRPPYSVTSEIQRRSLRESSPGHVETGSSSTSGPGPDRTTRSSTRSHTAPYHTGRYQDPASANNAPHSRKQRKPAARLGHNSLPSSSMPSPAIPSPAGPSPAPRIVSFGSSAVRCVRFCSRTFFRRSFFPFPLFSFFCIAHLASLPMFPRFCDQDLREAPCLYLRRRPNPCPDSLCGLILIMTRKLSWSRLFLSCLVSRRRT